MSSADLQLLRNAMKKDPKAYTDELALQVCLPGRSIGCGCGLENRLQQGVLTCKQYQVRHYHATVDIFKSKPSKPSEQLVDAATLLAHVTPCYPRELASFPMQLLQLLEAHHLLMHGSVRKVFAAVRL